MHDIDRTTLEMPYGETQYGEYETDEYGYEFEEEYAAPIISESPFSEAEEMELASELLSVANEEELEQFLGKLIRKAGRAVGKIVRTPIGKAVGGIVKSAANSALPMVGSTLGNLVLPGLGGAVGGKLASAAGSLLGLELEGLSQEDQEFEAARQLVRFAGATASQAAQAAPSTPPAVAAQQAAVQAAQQYAPGLLRPNGGQGAGTGRCQHPQSGRWVRKGKTIILMGV